jgi:hypothetical protein
MTNQYDKLTKINPGTFNALITTTSEKYPFLSTERKKTLLAILESLPQSPFFLREKPTPVSSSLKYLETVLPVPVQREDLVFVLAALKVTLGVRATKSRKTFKIFPDGLPEPSKSYELFTIANKHAAEILGYAISDVIEPTKQEKANIQSCTNKLIKMFEIKGKALKLYQKSQEGLSLSQAKKDLRMGDREFATAYEMLAQAGLIKRRHVKRKKALELSAENAAFVQTVADREHCSPEDVLNKLVSVARAKAARQSASAA